MRRLAKSIAKLLFVKIPMTSRTPWSCAGEYGSGSCGASLPSGHGSMMEGVRSRYGCAVFRGKNCSGNLEQAQGSVVPAL